MKSINFSNRAFPLLVCVLATLLKLAPHHEAFSIDHITVVEILSGKVTFKLEPYGNVRVKVFQGQTLQYEFLLDRETKQRLHTHDIARANIYLVGKYEGCLK